MGKIVAKLQKLRKNFESCLKLLIGSFYIQTSYVVPQMTANGRILNKHFYYIAFLYKKRGGIEFQVKSLDGVERFFELLGRNHGVVSSYESVVRSSIGSEPNTSFG